MTVKDENGRPQISIANNERAVNVITKILDIITAKNSVYVGEDAVLKQMFVESKGLFYAEVLKVVEEIRDVDIKLGILPVPKYNETQKEFYHLIVVYLCKVCAKT